MFTQGPAMRIMHHSETETIRTIHTHIANHWLPRSFHAGSTPHVIVILAIVVLLAPAMLARVPLLWGPLLQFQLFRNHFFDVKLTDLSIHRIKTCVGLVKTLLVSF